jgi:hypothetical protein
MATAILKGGYEEGSTVQVDFDGNAFTFASQPSELVES